MRTFDWNVVKLNTYISCMSLKSDEEISLHYFKYNLREPFASSTL
jgi:hypothetical protein